MEEEVPKENYKFKILKHVMGRKNQGGKSDELCSLRKKGKGLTRHRKFIFSSVI